MKKQFPSSKPLPLQFLTFVVLLWISGLGFTQEPKPDTTGGEISTLSSLRLESFALRKELEKPLQEFQEKYQSSLQALREENLKAGALEELLLVEEEMKGFRKGDHASAEDSFAALIRLQKIYQEGRLKLSLEKHKKALGLSRQYLSRLDVLKIRLTKEEKIKDAKEVLAEVKAVEKQVDELELQIEEQTIVESNSGKKILSVMDEGITKEQPFKNSLGMQFIPVKIYRGKPILMSKWETRAKDYQEHIDDDHDREWERPDFITRDDHPAVAIGWTDAVAFCEWLTERDRQKKVIGPTDLYRLPTDYEWSCAVGIGRSESPTKPHEKIEDVYPWGSEWPIPLNAGNYRRAELPGDTNEAVSVDVFVRAAPVGSFPPNDFGFFDLGGNAWEWCQDWFNPDKLDRRILRGGCWLDNSRDGILSSRRNSYPPLIGKPDSYGFRCVLSRE